MTGVSTVSVPVLAVLNLQSLNMIFMFRHHFLPSFHVTEHRIDASREPSYLRTQSFFYDRRHRKSDLVWDIHGSGGPNAWRGAAL
jgi:hypothetical protein